MVARVYNKLFTPIKKNPTALTNDIFRLFNISDLPILLPINTPSSKKIYDIIKQIIAGLNIETPVIPLETSSAKLVRHTASPNKYISIQLIFL
jgi:hypothetical protein